MRNRKPLCCALSLLAALALFFLAGCTQSTASDPFEYITVSYAGYSGNGTAVIEFDRNAYIASIIGDEPESLKELGQWIRDYDELNMAMDLTCTPETGLSNGDTVVVTITATGEASKKIKGGQKEFLVSDLVEVQTIDVFKDISLEYEGIIGGYTSCRVKIHLENEVVNTCQFRIEPGLNVRNGDVVTVTITNVEELAERFLCVPSETTKTFTVSGLDAYLTDPELLPADQIVEIIEQYLPLSREKDDFLFTHSEPTYYKTFFCLGKENVIGADVNRLQIFICYDEYLRGEYYRTVYIPLIFRNIVIHDDGTIDLSYEDGITNVFYTDPESLLETMRELYIVEEVMIEY